MPPKLQRGRPRTRYIPRGRAARAIQLNGHADSQPAEPPSLAHTNSSTSPQNGISIPDDMSEFVRLASQTHGAPLAIVPSGSNQPALLDNIPRGDGTRWQHLGTFPTYYCPDWFDLQVNI